MTRTEDREALGLLAQELHVDVAALGTRINALGGALEHVLDVLEALSQSQEHIDWHIAEARVDLDRTR